MTTINQSDIPSWYPKYNNHDSNNKPKSFKLLEGSAEIEFRSNGREYHSELDGKDYIVFEIVKGEELMNWYVNSKSYSVINTIKAMGLPLSGRRVIVSRIGKGKLDTRWSITQLNET